MKLSRKYRSILSLVARGGVWYTDTMLKRFLRLSVTVSYIALANFCFICAVNAQMNPPTMDSGHCPMSAPKKSCCDGSTSNTQSTTDDACSFSMDDSAAIFKIVDISVKPSFVQIESLDVLSHI